MEVAAEETPWTEDVNSWDSRSAGINSGKWIDFYHEVRQYVRAGFDPLEACCEARHNIFVTYPELYEL